MLQMAAIALWVQQTPGLGGRRVGPITPSTRFYVQPKPGEEKLKDSNVSVCLLSLPMEAK